jgi:Fic family protein
MTLNLKRLIGVKQAVLVHLDLVGIHPFVDGNDRISRLLMNFILMKQSYFPAVILKNNRKRYYDSLDKDYKGQSGKRQSALMPWKTIFSLLSQINPRSAFRLH